MAKKKMGRRPWVAEEQKMIGRNMTFPRPMVQWLEEEAARREVSVSEVVRQAVEQLRAYLEPGA